MMATSPKMIKAAERALAAKKAANEKAEKQAAKDAMAPVGAMGPEHKRAKGQQATLHALNMQQRAFDRATRDDIQSASIAAAKAVKQSLSGQNASGVIGVNEAKTLAALAAKAVKDGNKPTAAAPPRPTSGGTLPKGGPKAN
jgi:hypothetical protein